MENYLNEITELETLIGNVNLQRYELEKSNRARIKEVLDNIFNPFKEYTITVNGDSATFHMKDEDGRNREIFSISFYERYKEDATLDLSYYTTSTRSDFELDRLIFLGQVAKIVRTRSQIILKTILDIKNVDKERSNELYRIQDGYQKKITEYRDAVVANRKVKIELALRGDGVVFTSAKEIELKHNFYPYMIQIKIIDVSNSVISFK